MQAMLHAHDMGRAAAIQHLTIIQKVSQSLLINSAMLLSPHSLLEALTLL